MISFEERVIGNEIIADFLDWEKRFDDYEQGFVYKVPNNFEVNTGWLEMDPEGFTFDNDWNWIHYLWDELHRKVCIPMVRDNNHLKWIRPIIQETKKAIVWGHKETVYKNMVELIKLYNSQFTQ